MDRYFSEGMTQTHLREDGHTDHPAAPSESRRHEYFINVAINGVMLYVAHNLLEWEWPGFLTKDFDQLLPWVTASCVIAMAVNFVLLLVDDGRTKALGNLLTSCIGLALAVRTLQVFPFDFSGYDNDWSWLVRGLAVLALIGSGIGIIVNLVKVTLSLLTEHPVRTQSH